MGDFIGPALPPHLQPTCEQVEDRNYSPEAEADGPALPPRFFGKNDPSGTTGCDGPPTPNDSCIEQTSSEPLKVLQNKNDDLDSEVGGGDMYGPVLPPGLAARSSSRVLGPTLPQGFRPGQGDDSSSSSSSDGEVVGPLPPTECLASQGHSHVQEALERRAQALKRKFTSEADCSEPDGLQRESWMLELPPDRAKEFGLGPRQFRRREAQDTGDRSVWTDTPEDRANKKRSRKDEAECEMRQLVVSARDTEMEALVKRHGKGRGKEKSLLEAHQEKLKKKKQIADDDGKPIERRPFDRNIDLQANRFDEAQKKSIFKKAQLLNDRFSRGESKFL